MFGATTVMRKRVKEAFLPSLAVPNVWRSPVAAAPPLTAFTGPTLTPAGTSPSGLPRPLPPHRLPGSALGHDVTGSPPLLRTPVKPLMSTLRVLHPRTPPAGVPAAILAQMTATPAGTCSRREARQGSPRIRRRRPVGLAATGSSGAAGPPCCQRQPKRSR